MDKSTHEVCLEDAPGRAKGTALIQRALNESRVYQVEIFRRVGIRMARITIGDSA